MYDANLDAITENLKTASRDGLPTAQLEAAYHRMTELEAEDGTRTETYLRLEESTWELEEELKAPTTARNFCDGECHTETADA